MGEISKQIEHLMILAWTLYLLIFDIKDYSSVVIDNVNTFVCYIIAILICAVIYYLIGLFICKITRRLYERLQKSK